MSTTGQTVRKVMESGTFAETAEYAQSSVEISRTAKGEVTYSVKIYAIDPDEARAVALAQFRALQERFYPSLEKQLENSAKKMAEEQVCGTCLQPKHPGVLCVDALEEDTGR